VSGGWLGGYISDPYRPRQTLQIPSFGFHSSRLVCSFVQISIIACRPNPARCSAWLRRLMGRRRCADGRSDPPQYRVARSCRSVSWAVGWVLAGPVQAILFLLFAGGESPVAGVSIGALPALLVFYLAPLCHRAGNRRRTLTAGSITAIVRRC